MIDLPLHQFKDMWVNNDITQDSGKEIVTQGNKEDMVMESSNVPVDVEMEIVKKETHPPSTGLPSILGYDENHTDDYQLTSLLPIEKIIDTPLANEEDELAQDGETPEDVQNSSPTSSYFDPNIWKEPDTLQHT